MPVTARAFSFFVAHDEEKGEKFIHPLWRQKAVFFFDLDGTLYFRDQPAPRADQLLMLLREKGKKVGFITNNSRQSADEIALKLLGMGLPCHAADIICGTDSIGLYLQENYGRQAVKIAGSEQLARSLIASGHEVLPLLSKGQAQVVIIGRDTEFTYDKLQQVEAEAAGGAELLAVNGDLFHPGPGGRRVPETGALVRAIEAVTGKVIPIIGKPELHLFTYAMQQLETTAQHCVMIGDNLETDIAGAARAGMSTVWIRSGGMGQTLEGRSSAEKPDFVIDGLDELITVIANC